MVRQAPVHGWVPGDRKPPARRCAGGSAVRRRTRNAAGLQIAGSAWTFTKMYGVAAPRKSLAPVQNRALRTRQGRADRRSSGEGTTVFDQPPQMPKAAL